MGSSRWVIAAVMLLALELEGCGLFGTQTVDLTDSERAVIVAQLGELNEANREAWEAEVSKLFDATVLRLEKEGEKITSTLQAPALDAVERSGPTIIDKIGENPTPYGIAASVIAVGSCIWAYLAKRQALAERKALAAVVTGGAK